MLGPDSSYSCLEIHICWKVEREARMPIRTGVLALREGDDLDLHGRRGRAR
jgi:hypothetical protein